MRVLAALFEALLAPSAISLPSGFAEIVSDCLPVIHSIASIFMTGWTPKGKPR